MQVKLKVATGSHDGKEIVVGQKKFLIGRSEKCQLRPKSESVSRRHCILVIRENQLLVQDLKSRNGTFVNDERLPTDRAKILQHGDVLRVGKLTFNVLIDHGLGGAKRPEVKDMKDAASRTVEGRGDSRFEEVDINSWLDEADEIDRIRKIGDPDTRQMKLDDLKQQTSEESGELSVDETVSNEASDTMKSRGKGKAADEKADEESSEAKKRVRPPKGPPKKLPKGAISNMTSDSREAAGDALKRFFSGR
ncbi:FHA domain-containing protein [Roseimaritima ulvae]|uniref:Oxoglutarate dehydrogenase inhibitor n=1 Tax=Roseimaritima ulvae TaxID=980254 RepID=A0A5B9QV61_9BACT|nr:FHA domain-containing protein [Roseimaritima ulvae]QEG42914.1 Oxoglutarate dehydrogenase inhibitor [Roseimaritima ulvae]